MSECGGWRANERQTHLASKIFEEFGLTLDNSLGFVQLVFRLLPVEGSAKFQQACELGEDG